MSYIFYDTETTGTDVNFDQILQFAAIRTDADLIELDRFEVRCRLQEHLAPSPGAMRVTGVTVAQLTDPSLPSHYEMFRGIREKLLAWSPGIFAGYNSIAFDEPLLRQALYQTLHPPYLTNTNGNCRSDVLGLVQSAAFLDTDALAIPVGPKGKSSFKLEYLAPANGFDHENAHDALADVEATIHMCRLVRDRSPDCWSVFSRFSQKAAVVDFITEERAFLFLAHYFNKPFPYAVTLIKFDEEQSALAYVLDLAVNLPALAALDDGRLGAALKKSPKPVRKLKANGGPFVMGLDDVPGHVLQRLPSPEFLDQQLAWLDAHPDFLERVLSVYLSNTIEYKSAVHLEQRIHDGFSTSGDEKLLENFHAAPWEERFEIIESVSDDRYRLLGHRLIHSERPDLLPPLTKAAMDAEFAARLLGGEVGGEPWLTLPKALEKTNEMLKNASGDEHSLLSDLASYIERRIDELAAR